MLDYPCQLAIEKTEKLIDGLEATEVYVCRLIDRKLAIVLNHDNCTYLDDLVEQGIRRMCSECKYRKELEQVKGPDHQ